VNSELDGTWTEGFMTESTWKDLGKSQDSQESNCPVRDSNRTPPECKLERHRHASLLANYCCLE
jgi:hypothetical protein